MAKGFLDGVNVKKLLIGVVVLFIYTFASDFIIHGPIMGQHYKDTMGVWRPEAEMSKYMPVMMLGQFVFALTFVFTFAKGYQKRGWMEGVRFGFIVWGFVLAGNLMQYSVYPINEMILGGWVVATLIQSLVGGVIASLVYKK